MQQYIAQLTMLYNRENRRPMDINHGKEALKVRSSLDLLLDSCKAYSVLSHSGLTTRSSRGSS